MKKVAIVGAAAVGDYIFKVNHLPEKGEIVAITSEGAEKVPGGCAPNIACGIANLNQIQPVLYYPVGYDFEEWDVYSDWRNRGIECRLAYSKEHKCGCAWMYMQDDGTTMCFSYQGAADSTKSNETEMDEEMVVISPLLRHYTYAFLEEAIKKQSQIFVTGIGEKKLIPYLGRIHTLLVNKCESEQLCKESGADNMISFSKKYPFLKIYVTNGGKGSDYYKGGKKQHIPLITADQIEDYTGAGDAYTSGIVSAVAAGFNDIQAGYIGACAASFCIQCMGGQTYRSHWEQLIERLDGQYPDWKEQKMET